jgi:DNA topoisomerase-1
MAPFRNYKASGRGNGGRFGGRFGNKNKNNTKQETENTNAQYLVIVESPSKCPKIAHYLGEQYQVIASIGHIRELTSLKNAYDPTSSQSVVRTPPHSISQTSETNPASEIPPTPTDQTAPKKRGRPPKTATSNILIPTKKTSIQTPIFTICKDKLAHVEKMRTIMARFPKSNILLATDDDREGEAIAWHICQVFDLPLETTRRIVFHSITYEEIVKAVQNPRPVDMNLVHAQQSRQILDVIVGFKISPFLWKHVGNQANAKQGESLSAGRCQTPALRLVYDAHLKANAHNTSSDPLSDKETEKETEKETGKYKVKANFFADNLEFAAKIHDDFPLKNPQQMQTFLEQSLTWNHKLQLIPTSKHSQSQPPKPFTTSHLLQIASSRLGMSPKATMMLCQKLYQNGHITYMRTDCANYSPEFIATAHAFIGKSYGNKYISGSQISDTTSQNHPHTHPAKENANKSGKEKAVQAQEAHEAIRVTHLETMGQLGHVKKRGRPKANVENGADQESGDDDESDQESDGPETGNADKSGDKSRMNTLYQLIWQNTVESCMSPYHSEKTPITISGPQLAQYQYEIEIPKFLGWKIVKTTEKENRTFTEKQQAILNYLNQVNPESNLIPTKITAEYTEPRPPFYYNEASLIEKLESAGIGRPSTFAMLVETIQDRGYVVKRDLEGRAVSCIDFVCEPQSHKEKIKRIQTQKKMGAQKAKLVIQPVGIQVLKFLLEHFPSMFDYEYTSLLEKKLDEIAKGLIENGQIERECYDQITQLCRPLSRLEKREYILKDNPEYKVGYGISGPMVYRYVSEDVANAVRVSVQPNDVSEMVEGGHENDLDDFVEDIVEDIAETKPKKKTPKPKPEKQKKEYLPLKKNIQWDQEKLEKGLYQLSELVEFSDPHLGVLDDLPVYLKKGKFGPYVQWGDKNVPIQSLIKTGIQMSDLTLEHVLDLLKPTNQAELKPSTDKKVLRVFSKEVSVRMGKFGAYVFVVAPKSTTVAKKGYKKPQQEKPTFISLASLGENYMTCSQDKFMTWLEKMLLK